MAGKIEAETLVAAPPEEVFDYLAQLQNHWRLMDESVDVLALDGDGEAGPDRGVVHMHGPLGIGRTAHTRVLELDRPRLLRGIAGIGRRTNGAHRTEGEVIWHLEPEGDGTRVRLIAAVTRASAGDRLLLALGGRTWMVARFRLALRHLEELYAAIQPAQESALTPVSEPRT